MSNLDPKLVGCSCFEFSETIGPDLSLLWCRSCGSFARVDFYGRVGTWKAPARETALRAMIDRLAVAVASSPSVAHEAELGPVRVKSVGDCISCGKDSPAVAPLCSVCIGRVTL
jgi:hypothetical protein